MSTNFNNLTNLNNYNNCNNYNYYSNCDNYDNSSVSADSFKAGQKKLAQLWQKGAEFLGCNYPIMGGAMSWISEHNLVSAISISGGFGVIACSAMSPAQLEEEIILTQKKLKELKGSLIVENKESSAHKGLAPNFGVNIILMHPQLEELLDICIKNAVTHIILAGGLPTKATISRLKVKNIKVLAFAPSLTIARRLVRVGIDALIIEGMEAGGHIGPVSTSVLAQEIIGNISEVPIFVAGGIGTGAIIVNYLNMGASGCQVGTLFACAKESIAHPDFKQKFIEASSYDTVVSPQLDENFKVIPVRSIKNSSTKEFINFQKSIIDQYHRNEITKEEGQLSIEKFWAGSLRRAVIEGDVENGSLMAGQIVGLIREELPANIILETLVREAINYITNITRNIANNINNISSNENNNCVSDNDSLTSTTANVNQANNITNRLENKLEGRVLS